MIVLVLVVDSLRADAPGFGGGEARTPLLDQMAADGTAFTQTIASAGWTVPSLNAIAAGTFPHRIGVSRWRHPYPKRRPTLFTAFGAAGFEVFSFFHNPRWAFAGTQARGTVGDSQNRAAICSALRAPRGSDRFVFVHHWWTHLPYRTEAIPRKPWKALCNEILGELAADPDSQRPRWRRAYLDTVEFLDRELLGAYLEAAQSGGDDVLVCVTADHGENWGESVPEGHEVGHIYDLHGRWLTDDTTHVPLMFFGGRGSAKVPPSQRLGGFARGVDVAPTVCGLAGVPWPGPLSDAEGDTLIDRGIESEEDLKLDGVSLEPSLVSGDPAPSPTALTVTSHNAVVPARYPKAARTMWRRFSVRTDRARYVWDGVDKTRHVQDAQGGLQMEPGRRPWAALRDRLTGAGRHYGEMSAERKRAVGPGPMLEKDQFPGFGDDDAMLDEAEGAAGSVGESMRMLGYTDD
ncbi:MAG: sulfatase-like hydrolase/transferase [Deltaproteobacteria bacterium]|nr:sulfatase-like hydrolase/transferase [Deltaproteobacteria bacterium]